MSFIRQTGRSVLCAVLSIVFFVPQASPQTALSEIIGDVLDQSGTAISQVEVKLTNEATGVESVLATNEVGTFSSRSLQPGVYRIEAARPGFKTYVADACRTPHRAGASQ